MKRLVVFEPGILDYIADMIPEINFLVSEAPVFDKYPAEFYFTFDNDKYRDKIAGECECVFSGGQLMLFKNFKLYAEPTERLSCSFWGSPIYRVW